MKEGTGERADRERKEEKAERERKRKQWLLTAIVTVVYIISSTFLFHPGSCQ